MSEHRPGPADSAASEAAALRQTGASPLRDGDPRRIGPYAALALLGSGGMGRVYLARPVDGSPLLVAVKVIRPEYADDPGFRRRFEREASVHGRLRTPHTPKLRGTGFQDELLWMATEYVPGLDLAVAVREDGAVEPAAAWRLLADVGRALVELGASGIVHRDLKPSNVLLSPWGAYVIDFGLSKAVDASALTGTGNRVGTPAYMSPEHLRTGRCTTASDVFSLAGTLVYAVTGRAPFGDGTGVDVMHRVAFEEPDADLLGEVATLDTELGALLSACLAKEPERRPTAQDLVNAAAEHTGPAIWPPALRARVAERERAFEVLRSLPPERVRAPRGAEGGPQPGQGGPATGEPDTGHEPAARQPVAAHLSEEDEISGAAPSAAGGARVWMRRKPVLAVAAGVVVCVVAGTVVLGREDAPATASPPGSRTTAGATSGTSVLPLAPGASGRASAASGTSVDGNASGAAVPGGTEAAGSTGAGRPATASAAGADPSAPATVAASPSPSDSPAATPGDAPWNSECAYYPGYGRTSEGDSGKRVLQVQCMLTERGYSVGDSGVDGYFGADTEAAVENFQSARGLDADGVVDHGTWTALRSTE
ncbi:protein kinase domain-containing protein [Streptomyces sp. 7R007]